MKTPKINIDRAVPTDEEIAARMNFNKLNSQYKQVAGKPFYLKPRFMQGFMAVAAILVVVVITWVVYPRNEGPFINPPIAGLEVQFASYTVDATTGMEIMYPTGSRIRIPKDAFLDADGKVVTGKVDLKYREFHDPVDIIFSGIPMGYDSAGNKLNLESAGMMEIGATQNGQTLFTNPASPIEVNLATSDPKVDHNVYQLDTTARQWAYKGKPVISERQPGAAPANDMGALTETNGEATHIKPVVNPGGTPTPELQQIQQKLLAVQAETEKIEDKAPIKPRKVDEEKQRFNLDIEPAEFPELMVYDGIYFEPAPGVKIEQRYFDIVWEDAQLGKVDEEGRYQLVLTKGSEKVQFTVIPVYEGKSYETVKKLYDQKYTAYTMALNEKKMEEKRLQDEYDKKIKDQKAAQLAAEENYKKQVAAQEKMNTEQQKQWEADQAKMVAQQQQWDADRERNDSLQVEYNKQYQQQVAQYQAEQTKWAISQGAVSVVYRTFTLTGFGIWNCDDPISPPKGAQLVTAFRDEQGQDLKLNTLYLVELTRNTVFTISSVNSLQYNPKAKNMLIGITLDSEIIKYTPEDFAKIPAKADEHIFKVKPQKADEAALEDLKKLLYKS